MDRAHMDKRSQALGSAVLETPLALGLRRQVWERASVADFQACLPCPPVRMSLEESRVIRDKGDHGCLTSGRV